MQTKTRAYTLNRVTAFNISKPTMGLQHVSATCIKVLLHRRKAVEVEAVEVEAVEVEAVEVEAVEVEAVEVEAVEAELRALEEVNEQLAQ